MWCLRRPMEPPWKLLSLYEFVKYWRCEALVHCKSPPLEARYRGLLRIHSALEVRKQARHVAFALGLLARRVAAQPVPVCLRRARREIVQRVRAPLALAGIVIPRRSGNAGLHHSYIVQLEHVCAAAAF